jgi:NADH oxidase (H2O2-forming)
LKRRGRIAILGNGVAGNTALDVIRRADPFTPVVLISEEPYPEYSACVLPHYLSGVLRRKEVFLKSLKDYRGVTTRLGKRVRRIDPVGRRLFFEEGSISYDRLILAAGGEPVIPPLEGIEGRGIVPLKTLKDADRLARIPRGKIVVIGSGLVGVESAVAMRKRGHDVSLISRRWVLPRIIDEEVSERALRILERSGIKVFPWQAVKGIALKGRKAASVLTEKLELPCDSVIVAMGVKPRVGLARGAGIETGPLGGVRVNEKMETTRPGIYACGDCAEPEDPMTGKTVLPLRWFNARQMGRVAGFNCTGAASTYGSVLSGVTLDLFGTAVGSVGELSADPGGSAAEVLDADYGSSYSRVLVAENAVKGAQFIGRTEEAGIFFSLIRNGYSYEDVSRGISRFPWHRRVEPYLRRR